MYLTGGAGLILADFGGGSGTAVQLGAGVGWRKPSSKPHSVAPPAVGTNVTEQARNFVAWLRQHTR